MHPVAMWVLNLFSRHPQPLPTWRDSPCGCGRIEVAPWGTGTVQCPDCGAVVEMRPLGPAYADLCERHPAIRVDDWRCACGARRQFGDGRPKMEICTWSLGHEGWYHECRPGIKRLTRHVPA